MSARAVVANQPRSTCSRVSKTRRKGRSLSTVESSTMFPPGARDIAMVFQSYALYPHMTVRQNIGFGLEVRGVDKDEIGRRVDEAAQILDIGPLLDRRPKELSGGQRQRVALGRAITRDPKVFLLDEPLSNLDAQLRTQMRAELRLLFRRIEGTAVYVTHDQAEAMTLSDRLVVMRDGYVQQVGTPLEVYNQPANMFVAQFLGSPGMNFVPGVVSSADGQPVVRTAAGTVSLSGGAVATGDLVSDQSVAIGIRPEDIQIEIEDAGELSATIEVVEPLGSANLVYARLGDQRLAITTDPDLHRTVRRKPPAPLSTRKKHSSSIRRAARCSGPSPRLSQILDGVI